MIIIAAASSGDSSSGVDSAIIALDLVYAGIYLAFGTLRVAYHFYFRTLRASRPRTPILRYWLALGVFIVFVAGGWIFVGGYWVYKDTERFLSSRVSSSLVRIVLFLPAYVLMVAGGWLLVGAYSLIKKYRQKNGREAYASHLERARPR